MKISRLFCIYLFLCFFASCASIHQEKVNKSLTADFYLKLVSQEDNPSIDMKEIEKNFLHIASKIQNTTEINGFSNPKQTLNDIALIIKEEKIENVPNKFSLLPTSVINYKIADDLNLGLFYVALGNSLGLDISLVEDSLFDQYFIRYHSASGDIDWNPITLQVYENLQNNNHIKIILPQSEVLKDYVIRERIWSLFYQADFKSIKKILEKNKMVSSLPSMEIVNLYMDWFQHSSETCSVANRKKINAFSKFQCEVLKSNFKNAIAISNELPKNEKKSSSVILNLAFVYNWNNKPERAFNKLNTYLEIENIPFDDSNRFIKKFAWLLESGIRKKNNH